MIKTDDVFNRNGRCVLVLTYLPPPDMICASVTGNRRSRRIIRLQSLLNCFYLLTMRNSQQVRGVVVQELKNPAR